MKKLVREDILVFADGVIPAQDYDFLYQAGVVAIFGLVLLMRRLLVRLWRLC